MKYAFAVVLIVLALAMIPGAQTVQIGLTTATALSGCQSNASYTLCLYGSSTAPSMAVSVGGGAFATVQGAPGPAGPIGATGPAGPIGPAGPAGTSATWTGFQCGTWSGGSTSLSASVCVPK